MYAIVLAGGKGTRMKSPLPKVLHKICNKPMISYIISVLRSLKEIEGIVVVVGYKRELVKRILPVGVKTALQKELLGTADAVKAAGKVLKGFKGNALVLCGDTPLVTAKTISAIMGKHLGELNDVTMVTMEVKDPKGYGRIIRTGSGKVLGIVEEKSAAPKQKKIKEVNSGAYIFDWPKLEYALGRIKKNKLKGEYYLTDAIEIFRKKGYKLGTYKVKDPAEMLGVDDVERLKSAKKILVKRKS
ncbi:MAG: sugar phosphate nucleotidyltransferase [Candidatus Firestonebacteria bacterium]